MKAKTMRLTVLCPFCKTAYTFKSEANKEIWESKGSKDALHESCKRVQRFVRFEDA